MDPKDAIAKLDAYHTQLRRQASEEYEAAIRAYKALAAGTPLISLVDAFRQTGLGQDNRPQLAIARADRHQVLVRIHQDTLEFNTQSNPWHQKYTGSLVIYVPFQHHANPARLPHGYALAPMTPLSSNLREYFVLWEVERWSDKPIHTSPDLDHYLLLHHIAGYLYAIVAEWNLTEAEQAITN